MCNSDEIMREKLSKVLHASAMGKRLCALVGVPIIYLENADFGFVLCIIRFIMQCIVISYKFCVEVPII